MSAVARFDLKMDAEEKEAIAKDQRLTPYLPPKRGR